MSTPVVHDAFQGHGSESDSVGTDSMSYTVTAGAEILIVACGVDVATDVNPVATSSLDTLTAMPGGEVISNANNQALALFYVLNPTPGTHTLTNTWDGGGSLSTTGCIMAVTYDTLNASTKFADVNTDSGSDTSNSTTVANVLGVDVVLDFFLVNSNPAITIGADQTQRINSSTGTSGGTMYGASTQSGANGGVMSESWTGAQRTAQVALRLPGTAAAATNQDSDVGSRRNRPGRGPYSKGAYRRVQLDVSAQPLPPPALAFIEYTDTGTTRPRPGRGPYSLGRYFRVRPEAFTDTPAGTVYTESVSEVLSAADALLNLNTALNAFTESGSAAEALTHTAIVANGLSEAGAAADTGTNTAIVVEGTSESGSASDSLADSLGAQTYNEGVSESGSAGDALANNGVLGNTVSESGTASDTSDTPGSTYNVAVTEAASASDALTDSIPPPPDPTGPGSLVIARRRLPR